LIRSRRKGSFLFFFVWSDLNNDLTGPSSCCGIYCAATRTAITFRVHTIQSISPQNEKVAERTRVQGSTRTAIPPTRIRAWCSPAWPRFLFFLLRAWWLPCAGLACCRARWAGSTGLTLGWLHWHSPSHHLAATANTLLHTTARAEAKTTRSRYESRVVRDAYRRDGQGTLCSLSLYHTREAEGGRHGAVGGRLHDSSHRRWTATSTAITRLRGVVDGVERMLTCVCAVSHVDEERQGRFEDASHLDPAEGCYRHCAAKEGKPAISHTDCTQTQSYIPYFCSPTKACTDHAHAPCRSSRRSPTCHPRKPSDQATSPSPPATSCTSSLARTTPSGTKHATRCKAHEGSFPSSSSRQ
jgi:hypothetical protein